MVLNGVKGNFRASLPFFFVRDIFFFPNPVKGPGSNCTYVTAFYIIRTSTYQCEDPHSQNDFSTVL